MTPRFMAGATGTMELPLTEMGKKLWEDIQGSGTEGGQVCTSEAQAAYQKAK